MEGLKRIVVQSAFAGLTAALLSMLEQTFLGLEAWFIDAIIISLALGTVFAFEYYLEDKTLLQVLMG